MLIIGTSGTGIMMKQELYLRLGELEEFARFLNRLKGEMEYHRLPLAELCERICEKERGILYRILLDTVRSVRESGNLAFYDVWKKSFGKYEAKLHLTGEEKAWIKDLFSYSHASLESQLNELEYYYEFTNKRISELRTEVQGKGKVYITFGVMSGIMLLILFS